MVEPRLLDQVRDRVRFCHYSICIEQAYLGWIHRFIHFHKKRHPRDMGTAECEMFLSTGDSKEILINWPVRPELAEGLSMNGIFQSLLSSQRR